MSKKEQQWQLQRGVKMSEEGIAAINKLLVW